MNKFAYALLSMAFVLTGCAETRAQSDHLYVFSAEELGNGNRAGIVVLKYENRSGEAHCINQEEFGIHPPRQLFRIYSKDNKLASYVGKIADRPIEPHNTAFIIVPAGDSVSGNFDIARNYNVHDLDGVSVLYSLPITPCHALLKRSVDVPTASYPFYLAPMDDHSDWSGKLEAVFSAYEEWAETGFFAELESSQN